MIEKSVILNEKGLFHLYNYQSESELERMIVEHSSEIFGKNIQYFNKKRIESKAGFGTIPDGYIIDFDKNKLYIIEVELIKHDIKKHILPQISTFILAMQNENSKNKLISIFKEELSINLTSEKLKSIVANFSIVIIIDEVGDPMKEYNPLLEIVNFLSKHAEVKAIPFQTYVLNNNLSTHIHSFKSFTKKELEQESKKWTFKWKTVPVEKLLEKASEDIQGVFIKLGKKICCIASEIKEKHVKSGWTTYQISPLKNFCTIKILKNNLEIYLKVNKEKFNDKKEITKDITRTPSWTFDKTFTINKQSEINYAIELIKQSYQNICRKNNVKNNQC